MTSNAYDALDDGNVIIEVDKDDYVLALWFVSDDDGDWLACVCRTQGRNDDESVVE